jgi:cobalt-zinc-cadmium resistance protein CzcA
MISYINEVVIKGPLQFREAVMEGARRRLRPVMLTATIAALGLSPFLFASGPGSEIQKPLAIVVIGGLVTATLLTLILLPILYDRFGVPAAEKIRINEWKKRAAMLDRDSEMSYPGHDGDGEETAAAE